MSTIARLIGNSTWNGFAFLIGAALNLISIPYVINYIGIAEFGIAGLVTASIAPAMVISNSLYQVAIRQFAQSGTYGDRKVSANIFSTTLFLTLLFCTLGLFLLIAIAPFISAKLFSIKHKNHAELTIAFAIGGVSWAFRYLSETYQAPLAARQQFSDLAKISILTTVTSTLLIFVLVPMKPAATTYLLCTSLGFLCGFLCAAALAFKKVREQIRAPKLHRDQLSHFLQNGSWLAVSQVGGLVSGQTERYLLGALLGVQYVGLYNLAQRLEEALYIGVMKISEVLYPLFSSFSDEKEQQQSEMMFRASWLLTVVSTASLGGLIPIAELAIRLWTNAELAGETFKVLILLTLAGIFGCGTNVFKYYLLGRGKTKQNAIISLITSAFVVVSGTTLLLTIGWPAAGMSALIGMTIQLLIISALIYRSFPKSDTPSRIFHFIAFPMVIGGGTALLLLEALQSLTIPLTWWAIALLYALSAATITGSMLIAAMASSYRRIFLRDVKTVAAYIFAKMNAAADRIRLR